MWATRVPRWKGLRNWCWIWPSRHPSQCHTLNDLTIKTEELQLPGNRGMGFVGMGRYRTHGKEDGFARSEWTGTSRSEILSSGSRSINMRCSSVITGFFRVRTKARPHNLQRWFCFPVWIWPFLLYQVDPHYGHASLMFISLPLVFPLWCWV